MTKKLPDYGATLRRISDEFDHYHSQLQADDSLTEPQRVRLIKELKTEARTKYNEAKRDMERQMAADFKEAYKAANPPKVIRPGVETTSDLIAEIRRQDLKRELLERMKEDPAGILQMYDALTRDFDEAATIIEEYGPRYLPDEDREAFQATYDSRHPDRAKARTELAELKAHQDHVGAGVAMSERALLAKTEGADLAPAQAPAPDGGRQ